MTILRRSLLVLGLSTLGFSAFAASPLKSEQGSVVKWRIRGQAVKKLYTPVRSLQTLKSQYQDLLGKLENSATEVAAKKKALMGNYPFHGDAEGRTAYDALDNQERGLRQEISTAQGTLAQVTITQKQMAGVVKTALRTGSSETVSLAETKVLERTLPGFGSTPKVVAQAVVEEKGARFGLRIRHAKGHGETSEIMPGYKQITPHGIDVDLSKNQLVVSFSGHYTESGSKTKIVKTFDLTPTTSRPGFSVTQVK